MKLNFMMLSFWMALLCMEIIHESSAKKIKVKKLKPKAVQKLVKVTNNARPWEEVTSDQKLLSNILPLHFLCSSMLRPAVSGNSQTDPMYLQNWARKRLLKKTPKRNMDKVQSIFNIMCQKIYSLPEGQSARENMKIKYSKSSGNKAKNTNKLRSGGSKENQDDYDETLEKMEKELKSESDLESDEVKTKSNVNSMCRKEKTQNETKPSLKINMNATEKPVLIASTTLEEKSSKECSGSKENSELRNTTEKIAYTTVKIEIKEEFEKGGKSCVEKTLDPEQKTNIDTDSESDDKLNTDVILVNITMPTLNLTPSAEAMTPEQRNESVIKTETGGDIVSQEKSGEANLESNKKSEKLPEEDQERGVKTNIKEEDDSDIDKNPSPEINETVPSKKEEI